MSVAASTASRASNRGTRLVFSDALGKSFEKRAHGGAVGGFGLDQPDAYPKHMPPDPQRPIRFVDPCGHEALPISAVVDRRQHGLEIPNHDLKPINVAQSVDMTLHLRRDVVLAKDRAMGAVPDDGL